MKNSDIEDFLDTTCSKIKHISVREEIRNELYEHIIENKERYICNGFSDSEAGKKAIKDMGDPEIISKDFNNIYKRTLDWKLVAIFGILLLINVILIMTFYFRNAENNGYIIRNLLYLCVGIISSIIIYKMNYNKIKRHLWGCIIIGIVFNLISIITNYIITSNNGTYPIISNIFINPNIVATFMYIISYNIFLVDFNNKKYQIILFILISLSLLYFSKDVMMLIITLMTYIFLTYSKISIKFNSRYKKVFLIGIIALTIVISLYISITQPHYLLRFFNKNSQEQLIINSRLNHSKNLGTIDLQDDFTQLTNYSIIYLIESYGKIFGIFVITIFTLLSIRIIIDSRKIDNEFGKLLIIGLGAFLLLQCLINLFSILGILNIGKINLPFISYNDCAIIINMIAISMILSIYSRKSLKDELYQRL